MNLLIIGNRRSYSTKRIIEEAEKRKHKVNVHKPTDFYLYLSDVNGHDRVYLKASRLKKNQIDAVIPRIGQNLGYGSNVMRQLNYMGVFCTATGDGLLNASDKWKASQILSKNRLQIPKTALVHQAKKPKFLFNLLGGLPLVGKTLSSKTSQGAGVFILNDELSASTTLSSFASIKDNLLLSSFIESSAADEKKHDIRAFVVGDKVVAAYKRFSLDDDFRSNYSISKYGEKAELTDEEISMSVKAAKALNLGICGVDIMRDVTNDNKPYILECNGNSSLVGIERVSGVNVALKIVEYVESQQAKKEFSSVTIEAEMLMNEIGQIIDPKSYCSDDTNAELQKELETLLETKIGKGLFHFNVVQNRINQIKSLLNQNK